MDFRFHATHEHNNNDEQRYTHTFFFLLLVRVFKVTFLYIS